MLSFLYLVLACSSPAKVNLLFCSSAKFFNFCLGSELGVELPLPLEIPDLKQEWKLHSSLSSQIEAEKWMDVLCSHQLSLQDLIDGSKKSTQISFSCPLTALAVLQQKVENIEDAVFQTLWLPVSARRVPG